MKTRHLPPTDLARIAPLSTDEKVFQLRRFEFGAVPFTYNPVRLAIPDILDASGTLLESLGPTPLVEIERRIKRARMSDQGIEQNLKVARALHEYALLKTLKSRQRDFYSMTLGFIDQIRLWSDLVLVKDDKPLVVFFDTRRGNRLTAIGRKFAYSLQHQHVRLTDPDMVAAGLGVFQFPANGAERSTRLFVHDGSDLFSYEQLEAMIGETYIL